MRLKTRSSDRYIIAYSSPRNSNFKMESWWDVLPPELQEKILKLKEKMEHRDKMKALVEEIGEFYLQPLPEDDHQGDSCCFFLFSPRKVSHLPDCKNKKRTFPLFPMLVLSQNRKPENLSVIRPLWLPSMCFVHASMEVNL